jgi:hypothetical protein
MSPHPSLLLYVSPSPFLLFYVTLSQFAVVRNPYQFSALCSLISICCSTLPNLSFMFYVTPSYFAGLRYLISICCSTLPHLSLLFYVTSSQFDVERSPISVCFAILRYPISVCCSTYQSHFSVVCYPISICHCIRHPTTVCCGRVGTSQLTQPHLAFSVRNHTFRYTYPHLIAFWTPCVRRLRSGLNLSKLFICN